MFLMGFWGSIHIVELRTFFSRTLHLKDWTFADFNWNLHEDSQGQVQSSGWLHYAPLCYPLPCEEWVLSIQGWISTCPGQAHFWYHVCDLSFTCANCDGSCHSTIQWLPSCINDIPIKANDIFNVITALHLREERWLAGWWRLVKYFILVTMWL